jgi:hypothetical protein
VSGTWNADWMRPAKNVLRDVELELPLSEIRWLNQQFPVGAQVSFDFGVGEREALVVSVDLRGVMLQAGESPNRAQTFLPWTTVRAAVKKDQARRVEEMKMRSPGVDLSAWSGEDLKEMLESQFGGSTDPRCVSVDPRDPSKILIEHVVRCRCQP